MAPKSVWKLSGLVVSIVLGHLGSAQNTPRQRQQNPTLAETKEWIGNTFSRSSHIVHKGYELIEFDEPNHPCKLRFSVMDQIGQFPSSQFEDSFRFVQFVDLSEIDPNSIKMGKVIHDWDMSTVKSPSQANYATGEVQDHPYVFVDMRTVNDADIIFDSSRQIGKATRLSSKDHEVGFPNEGIAVDSEYAPRLINALRNAVEICGGKPSAF